jgi:C4-dicarboxylate-specific signal transduction histidine kinase
VLAILLTAAALGLTLVLQPLVSYPFLYPFLFAVFASAWFGGTGPGVLAVLLSTLAVVDLFIPPLGSLRVKLEDIPYLAAFACSAIVAGWLSFSLRRTEIALWERSVELQRTNELLRKDILERQRAEETLRQAQADLAHVTRVTTMGELAASIAHEVNQPLAAIVTNGNASLRWLAAESPNLNEARAAIERIIRDGNRASDVVGRIRSLLKKTTTRKERVDIRELIQDVSALAQGEMLRHDVSLRLELDAGCPPVVADRVQLQQVVLNLIVNGIEAMSAVTDRPRRLLIRALPDEAGGVRVAVQDCGIGIAPDALGHLFDAFYTTKPEGLGMGLAISRSIVEGHGGRLWMTPEAEGSNFQFTLPPTELASP